MGTLAAMDKLFRDLGGSVLGILPDKLSEPVEKGRLYGRAHEGDSGHASGISRCQGVGEGGCHS
jgi:hypothetical protein